MKTEMSGLRELEAIKGTVTGLQPGLTQKLTLEQLQLDTILISHFEVTELSPRGSAAELIDLRVGELSYLLAPASLQLLQREQQHTRARDEQRTRQRLQRLLGLEPALRLFQQFKPSRRDTRLISLDIRWKPQQQLSVALRNSGGAVIDKVSIEFVLYEFKGSLPVAN